MVKTTFILSDKASQTISALASFSYGAPTEVDPTRDFLTVGTPKDAHANVKFDVSGNDLK